MSTTKDILKHFNNNVDKDKTYSLEELIDILTISFNNKKSNKKDGVEKQKREPTAYNIFVKNRMAELKIEKDGMSAKDLMKIAAAEWTLQKNKD